MRENITYTTSMYLCTRTHVLPMYIVHVRVCNMNALLRTVQAKSSNRVCSSLSKTLATASVNVIRKKKLFLTDGTTVALTGICVYMLRVNNSKQLPEEGFHKVSH